MPRSGNDLIRFYGCVAPRWVWVTVIAGLYGAFLGIVWIPFGTALPKAGALAASAGAAIVLLPDLLHSLTADAEARMTIPMNEDGTRGRRA